MDNGTRMSVTPPKPEQVREFGFGYGAAVFLTAGYRPCRRV